MRKGYYVLLNVEATAEACNEFTRRVTGKSAKYQRLLVKTIKNSRHMTLLPFVKE